MLILKSPHFKTYSIASREYLPFPTHGYLGGGLLKSKEHLVRWMFGVIDICKLNAPPKIISDLVRSTEKKKRVRMSRSQYMTYRNLRDSDSVEQLIERTITALRSKGKENSEVHVLVEF